MVLFTYAFGALVTILTGSVVTTTVNAEICDGFFSTEMNYKMKVTLEIVKHCVSLDDYLFVSTRSSVSSFC